MQIGHADSLYHDSAVAWAQKIIIIFLIYSLKPGKKSRAPTSFDRGSSSPGRTTFSLSSKERVDWDLLSCPVAPAGMPAGLGLRLLFIFAAASELLLLHTKLCCLGKPAAPRYFKINTLQNPWEVVVVVRGSLSYPCALSFVCCWLLDSEIIFKPIHDFGQQSFFCLFILFFFVRTPLCLRSFHRCAADLLSFPSCEWISIARVHELFYTFFPFF